MLKMMTGLAAKVLRLGGTDESPEELPELQGGEAKALREQATIDDSEMLDWLDRQSKWSARVAFRWSTTGRGWRLMEVPTDYDGSDQATTTRHAIANAILTAWPERPIDKAGLVDADSVVRRVIASAMLVASPTDTRMLDWLDEQTGSYTGRVLWRLSTRGYGWRLHETSRVGAKATVRETISVAMQEEVTAAVEQLDQSAKDTLKIPKPSRMYCITQTGLKTFECQVMTQDDFERWEEASLDAAVESVISAADTINHASITCSNITIQLKDPVNAALCRKCGDIIISRHRHDFVECGCGSIGVHGGDDYNRRVGDLRDVKEVPTKALFDRLAKLLAKDRLKEWKRYG